MVTNYVTIFLGNLAGPAANYTFDKLAVVFSKHSLKQFSMWGLKLGMTKMLLVLIRFTKRVLKFTKHRPIYMIKYSQN
jgi:hypothetical protein